MDIHSQKQNFLLHELSLLSLTNALSTRDKLFPIYAPKANEVQKQKFKEALRTQLDNLLTQYNQKKISEAEHINNIQQFAQDISQQFGHILHEQTFRFGVAQKLLNLHLKYLWSAGFLMREPPHCPIDYFLRDKIDFSYNWVNNNQVSDYEIVIEQLKQYSNGQSLALWELKQSQNIVD